MKTATFDARWSAEYSYDTVRNCDESGCDSICRCSTLENLKVDEIRMTPAMFGFKHLSKTRRSVQYSPSTVELYCVDRLMRFHKAYDKDLYTASICGGYYGEEIDGVSFDNADDLVRDVQEMLNLESDIEKIKFVLMKEYSYLLEKIKDCSSVTIEQYVPAQLLKNDDYACRIKNENKAYEFAEDVPVGVVHSDRLIDGYHRMSSLDPNVAHSFIVLA